MKTRPKDRFESNTNILTDIGKKRICSRNPFLAGIDEKTIYQFEDVYELWHKNQLKRLYKLMNDYLYAPGVVPESPDKENSFELLYGSTKDIGYRFLDLVYPTDHPFPCKSIKPYGDNVGTQKFLCGLEQLDECIIYSLGSNNLFDFERAISKKTNCKVHIFDCTSDPPATEIENVQFHKICVGEPNNPGRSLQAKLFPYVNMPIEFDHSKDGGASIRNKIQSIDLVSYASIQQLLHHNESIHVLKMDVEGGEYAVFADLLTDQNAPYQISFESHWWNRGIGHGMLNLQVMNQLWNNGISIHQTRASRRLFLL